ncbi:amino acid permease [Rhizomicrobium electricum]|uniref:Amino acid permease n=1 Tax=Rhizomicrobium electricum TaxID=480070 RepID=A0ABN1E5X1_9PROT|nr:amino acid permease [Rhizomicrobium electricum]NIJ47734.1 APA family basic amino acid/polyamine antiporter [Rhizomicrobium electricum]
MAGVTEQQPVDLKPTLGPFHLIALGIGGIIGAGIFVITGHAAAIYAGPGVIISFAIAGFGCAFTGLCYAEFASMIPVAGSAYTYTYATMGRFMAWFIGWNLVLEYLAASSTVAVGWSGYFNDFMTYIGVHIPAAFAQAPIALEGVQQHLVVTGAYFNLPAVALICLVTAVLIVGVNMSANFNNAMVLIKTTIVIIVIAVGLPHVVSALHIPAQHDSVVPLIPANTTGVFGQFGWSGVLRATGLIFFAYIGFDAVSVASQEAKNPRRDVPLGILGSLAICTVLYILMAYVLTGIADYRNLNVPHPVSMALEQSASLKWLAPFVSVGAIVGLASVVLVFLLGQSRIFYAMAKDGLFFKVFGEVHPRFKTPWKGQLITGAFAILLAGLLPIDILNPLVSIGTLLAFVVVCIGTMILRVKRPKAIRPFRTPYLWIVAPIGIFMCALMMVFLPKETWERLIVWTAIGVVIYFAYGIRQVAGAQRWHIKDAE